jgi:hypothetical protein
MGHLTGSAGERFIEMHETFGQAVLVKDLSKGAWNVWTGSAGEGFFQRGMERLDMQCW